MPRDKIIFYSFLHAVAITLYVGLVAWLMSNGNRLFGVEDQNVVTPLAMLMLLVLSAAIVGTLIFLRPVLLYLDNLRKEAVVFLFSTLGWLLLFTVVIFILLATVFKTNMIY
ncbi:MAG: hypothetical protein M1383_03905 [Patescibacteria group bacterium]|nr:hypothetical protein [Patescibacteria group bacterium]